MPTPPISVNEVCVGATSYSPVCSEPPISDTKNAVPPGSPETWACEARDSTAGWGCSTGERSSVRTGGVHRTAVEGLGL